LAVEKNKKEIEQKDKEKSKYNENARIVWNEGAISSSPAAGGTTTGN
jgi:hypothetical protein